MDGMKLLGTKVTGGEGGMDEAGEIEVEEGETTKSSEEDITLILQIDKQINPINKLKGSNKISSTKPKIKQPRNLNLHILKTMKKPKKFLLSKILKMRKEQIERESKTWFKLLKILILQRRAAQRTLENLYFLLKKILSLNLRLSFLNQKHQIFLPLPLSKFCVSTLQMDRLFDKFTQTQMLRN